MKKSAAMLSLSLLTFILIVALALPVFAQEKEPADFGQKDWAWTWLGASDFMQVGISNLLWNVGGYYGRGSTDSGVQFTATMKLPSGSSVKRIIVHAYDDHATSNITWNVVKHWTGTDLYNNSVIIIDGLPFGAEGYGKRFADFNDPEFIFDNYDQYTVNIFMPQLNVSHRFKGVRIGYQRQISPAPSTATFSDVPTTHGFFRNIEALAASGITTGFSDGTFKPNEFVTRGQMAAFLSRALGLHFKEDIF